MEQRTGSKLGKQCVKAAYCHPAYLTYMQSTSCEMPGCMKHKLESRLPGEISITSDTQMTPPLRQKARWGKVKSLSHVRLFATLSTVAYQASPSMGFSKQEYWSGLPFPSPGDLIFPTQGLEADVLTSEPKQRRTKEPPDESERGEWKSSLKTQHSEN